MAERLDRLRIDQLRIPLGQLPPEMTPEDGDYEEIKRRTVLKAAAARLGVSPREVGGLTIRRESLDSRAGREPALVYTVEVEGPPTCPPTCPPASGGTGDVSAAGGVWLGFAPRPSFVPRPAEGSEPLKRQPIVVGAGPAGIFCALRLAAAGFKPVLLDRGREVRRRIKDIARFWTGGGFDPDSNVQFGEGGAGTFSDGKLTTRINDPRTDEVLATLVAAGAPEKILYVSKPHVGTDRLRLVVERLREMMIELGCQVRFEARVTDLLFENGRVAGVVVNDQEALSASVVVLAIGHSARDTYRMLAARGLRLAPKPFSVGVRIEHPQGAIDRAQYGRWAGHPALGPAEYQLSHRPAANSRGRRGGGSGEGNGGSDDRAVYAFCMCPGGHVVAAASEEGGVVTNGMSYEARSGENANSALVVSVGPDDYGPGPLDGVRFQRRWEEAAFRLGGSSYRAPAQTAGDFLAGRASSLGDLECGGVNGAIVRPTYRPGVTPADLHQCLPEPVTEMLAEGLRVFDRKIRGFGHPGALLTGVETRTSAPLRITRDEEGLAEGCPGLYPIGEGAGYAGGIVSAAVDGLRAAERIAARHRPGY